AGIYAVYAQDENGCIAETMVNVEDVDPFFIQSMTADTTLEYLDTLTISAEVNDTSGVTFTWTETNLNTLVNDTTYSFEITPDNSITYQFVATNENGCQVDSTVTVLVEKPRRIGVAAAFTPNGDGTNDYLFVQGDDKVASVNVLRVYSRWGELVFEGTDLTINEATQGWDGTHKGKPMNSGVFAWYAEVQFLDGHVEVIKGDITLLR
ncbi:MAG: gliding motility-associated C-terminal domain-containing protein, partial [Saprospiraceae bacterium]|nr:gliding motility-associated C-terminal domain-containing protein [Saprospiraceae bacterium]